MNCFKKQLQEINCQVCLLDGKILNVNVQGYAKGCDLLQKVYDQLNLVETDCFGLRYKDKDNSAQWLDPMKSLNKQIKNVSYLTLYFGVKFYLEDPCQLKEEVTRYQFFLQLKKDLLIGRIPCNTNMAAVLASLCVQSELGDYDPSQHTEGYISEFRFIPDQTEDFENHVEELHRSLRGMSPSAAEKKFLEKIQRLEMYGVDLHQVSGQDNKQYFLGLTPTGISIYQNKTNIAHYFWPIISRVHFEGTKFVLAVQRRSGGDNEYSFQLESKEACKHLWTCCVEQHAFFRLPSFSSTSFRHSGRTKKEALELSSSLRRKQPKVERTPSKRYSRRLSSESESEVVIARDSPRDVVDGEEIILSRSGRDSPTSAISTKSLPWENYSQFSGGLYSPSNDVYESYRSRKRKPQSRASSPGFNRRKYHSDRSGDESESSFARRYRRNVSLTELSDISGDEARHRRRRRKKSHGGDTSGSEAEYDHRRRRPHKSNGFVTGKGYNIDRRKMDDLQTSATLQDYIQQGLVDTSGLSPEQLQDISYVNVITDEDVSIRVSSSKRSHQRARRRGHYDEEDKLSVISGRESVYTTRSEVTPHRHKHSRMVRSPASMELSRYQATHSDTEGTKPLKQNKGMQNHRHENGFIKPRGNNISWYDDGRQSPQAEVVGMFHQQGSLDDPSPLSLPQRRLSQGQLSEEGLLAMQELKEELVKLGRPSVKRQSSKQDEDGERNQEKKELLSHRHKAVEERGQDGDRGDMRGDTKGGYIKTKDQDIPVNVISNKRMSLTTQEILRVSKSFGEHLDVMTEL
ncbi:Band 4.1-like protein 4A [Holothuria leucospilota]|uniref:Band 4.1-like protein 4A n=1 Tax=Holothuria leucospilota TaxID=206669 RepID=A0A9Q1HAX5_HOLLE|nr:Band 4.1-like protein 4A [Holothuria leucospilota]